MDLTYNIVLDELTQQFDCRLYSSNLSVAPFCSCLIYEEGMALDPRFIYVTRGVPLSLPSGSSRILFIICREAMNDASLRMMQGQSFIGFAEETSASSVVNILLKAFSRYNNWYEQLDTKVNQPGFLDNILQSTFPLLRNSLYLVDSQLRPVSIYDSSKGILDVLTADRKEQVLIRARKEYLKTRGLRDVYFRHLEGDHPRLLYNLYDGKTYVGILSLQGDASPIRPSDADILKTLGDYIARLFGHLGAKYSPQTNQLCDAIVGLLKDRKHAASRRKAVARFAGDAGIDETEEFRVLFVRKPEEAADRYLPYFLHSLAARLPALVLTCEDPEGEAAVLRMSYARSLGIDVDKVLVNYLDSFGFRAGLSDPFSDLSRVSAYFTQARAALRLSLTSEDSDSLSRFSVHYTDYLIRALTSDIPPQDLFSTSFRRILSLDADSKISYLETLRAYMRHHLSATKTANALYISRNAFMYRLEKILPILEECGEDLEDPNDFLRMEVSFLLYDRYGETEDPGADS